MAAPVSGSSSAAPACPGRRRQRDEPWGHRGPARRLGARPEGGRDQGAAGTFPSSPWRRTPWT